jgi:hypothetical protein
MAATISPMAPLQRVPHLLLVPLCLSLWPSASLGAKPAVALFRIRGPGAIAAGRTLEAAVSPRYAIVPGKALEMTCSRLGIPLRAGPHLVRATKELGIRAAILGRISRSRHLTLTVLSGRTGAVVERIALQWPKRASVLTRRKLRREVVQALHRAIYETPNRSQSEEHPEGRARPTHTHPPGNGGRRNEPRIEISSIEVSTHPPVSKPKRRHRKAARQISERPPRPTPSAPRDEPGIEISEHPPRPAPSAPRDEPGIEISEHPPRPTPSGPRDEPGIEISEHPPRPAPSAPRDEPGIEISEHPPRPAPSAPRDEPGTQLAESPPPRDSTRARGKAHADLGTAPSADLSPRKRAENDEAVIAFRPDGVERSDSQERPGPGAPGARLTPQAVAQLGLGFWSRSFSLDGPSPNREHGAYDSGAVFAIELAGRLYPASFFSESVAANLWVGFQFRTAVGLSSDMGLSSSEQDLGTNLWGLLVDVGYSWNVMGNAGSPVLDLGLGFGLLDFAIDWQRSDAVLSNVSYRYVGLCAALDYPIVRSLGNAALRRSLLAGLAVAGRFQYRIVTGVGDISQYAGIGYGETSAGGLEASIGLSWSRGGLFAQVMYHYELFFLSFDEERFDQRVRADLLAAAGARDQLHSFVIGGGYAF